MQPGSHHAKQNIFIVRGNREHGFDVVEVFKQVAPSYEDEVCDLIKRARHRQALRARMPSEATLAVARARRRSRAPTAAGRILVDWDYLAIVALSSLSSAAVLLIATLGLAVIFGLMGVINLAHGEFIMFGAYRRADRDAAAACRFPLAVAVATLATAAFGAIVERAGDPASLRSPARYAARHLGLEPRPLPDRGADLRLGDARHRHADLDHRHRPLHALEPTSCS